MKMQPDKLPQVSIIINNFNYERFVSQAIESALQQNYPEVEVIVVDDGSTDHSREIIQSYSEQVRLVLKENGGQCSALNAGFSNSNGEMVIFLDADDVLLPSAVKDVVDVYQSNPGIALVQFRMAVIDGQGRRTGIEKPEAHIPIASGDVHNQALTFPFDMSRMPTSGNAFSTGVLRQIMPIPEDGYGRLGADWYLIFLTYLAGSVFFLEKIEAYYRVHGANSYEQESASLDLKHIRNTIIYCSVTGDYLQKYAKQLGLTELPGEILSVSYIANRMISLRLEPQNHPISGDSRWKLIKLGAEATLRRYDVNAGLKILFISWFLLMAFAPKSLCIALARWFLFPQERKKLNRLLGKFHVQPKLSEVADQSYEGRE